MLIVIEGPDGCGKTTTAKALAKKIGAEYMAFPAEGYDYKAIRTYLAEKWYARPSPDVEIPVIDKYAEVFGVENSNQLSALLFQALMTCNKYAAVSKFQEFVGHKTRHMVMDRYWYSAWVYGCLDGLDEQWLRDIHSCLPKEDHTFLLSLDPVLAVERQTGRVGCKERYEGDRDRAQVLFDLYYSLWCREFMGSLGSRILSSDLPLEEVVLAMLDFDPLFGLTTVSSGGIIK